MSKILYAWELGGGYGHISAFLPVAQQLRAQGHQVTLALKDVSRAQALAGVRDFAVLQSPVCLAETIGLPEPIVAYPEILQRFGYLDPVALLGFTQAWRTLYQLTEPDLLIADHAPTALLAARGFSFRRATYGTGFCVPPRITPLPNMRPRLQVPLLRLVQSEQAVLDSVNQVLHYLDEPALDQLAALFAVDEDFLMTPAELDHYRHRKGARYYGAVLSAEGGATPPWPAGNGPRLFVYVKAPHPHLDALIAALRDSRFSVLAHLPGWSEAQRDAAQTTHLHISPQPVDMRYACETAAAVICQGGFGTLQDALLAGLPTLVLPAYLEQSLSAANVVRMGAGLRVDPEEPPPDFVALLDELLNNPGYRNAAHAYAEKYASVDQAQIISAVSARCIELLTQRNAA